MAKHSVSLGSIDSQSVAQLPSSFGSYDRGVAVIGSVGGRTSVFVHRNPGGLVMGNLKAGGFNRLSNSSPTATWNGENPIGRLITQRNGRYGFAVFGYGSPDIWWEEEGGQEFPNRILTFTSGSRKWRTIESEYVEGSTKGSGFVTDHASRPKMWVQGWLYPEDTVGYFHDATSTVEPDFDYNGGATFGCRLAPPLNRKGAPTLWSFQKKKRGSGFDIVVTRAKWHSSWSGGSFYGGEYVGTIPSLKQISDDPSVHVDRRFNGVMQVSVSGMRPSGHSGSGASYALTDQGFMLQGVVPSSPKMWCPPHPLPPPPRPIPFKLPPLSTRLLGGGGDQGFCTVHKANDLPHGEMWYPGYTSYDGTVAPGRPSLHFGVVAVGDFPSSLGAAPVVTSFGPGYELLRQGVVTYNSTPYNWYAFASTEWGLKQPEIHIAGQSGEYCEVMGHIFPVVAPQTTFEQYRLEYRDLTSAQIRDEMLKAMPDFKIECRVNEFSELGGTVPHMVPDHPPPYDPWEWITYVWPTPGGVDPRYTPRWATGTMPAADPGWGFRFTGITVNNGALYEHVFSYDDPKDNVGSCSYNSHGKLVHWGTAQYGQDRSNAHGPYYYDEGLRRRNLDVYEHGHYAAASMLRASKNSADWHPDGAYEFWQENEWYGANTEFTNVLPGNWGLPEHWYFENSYDEYVQMSSLAYVFGLTFTSGDKRTYTNLASSPPRYPFTGYYPD